MIYAVYLWAYPPCENGLHLFDIRDVHRGTLGQIRASCTVDALRRWMAAL